MSRSTQVWPAPQTCRLRTGVPGFTASPSRSIRNEWTRCALAASRRGADVPTDLWHSSCAMNLRAVNRRAGAAEAVTQSIEQSSIVVRQFPEHGARQILRGDVLPFEPHRLRVVVADPLLRVGVIQPWHFRHI